MMVVMTREGTACCYPMPFVNSYMVLHASCFSLMSAEVVSLSPTSESECSIEMPSRDHSSSAPPPPPSDNELSWGQRIKRWFNLNFVLPARSLEKMDLGSALILGERFY